jgi:hypothetical protein
VLPDCAKDARRCHILGFCRLREILGKSTVEAQKFTSVRAFSVAHAVMFVAVSAQVLG